MIDTYILLSWIAQHPSLAIVSIGFWIGVFCVLALVWLSKR